MVNLSTLYNSGSAYEQLISQVIAVESQPRLRLRAQQTDQTVYKGVLSDFSSRASTLNALMEKFQDPFRDPFASRAATVSDGAGFSASTSDDAAAGVHEIQVTRIARADARLSKQIDDAGTDLAARFTDPGDPGDPGSPGGPFGFPPPRPPRPATPDAFGERTFTIRIPQDEGDPVALDVRYTPAEGDTDGDIVAGLATAINDAAAAARTAGTLGDDTGVTALVVHETDGTSRLSLRSLATGYANRLGFEDPDGILGALEVDREAVRSGAGGGAVHAVGTGPQDSALTAAFTLDGLEIYRDTNTVDDALDGVTLSLRAPDDAPATLTVGPDTEGARSEVDAFLKAYNGLVSFLTDKTKVDADAGTRGAFAGDAAATGLRFGLRTEVARRGTGEIASLADLGITAARDGTLSITDSAALEAALADSPSAVGALFSGEDGLAARIAPRLDGLLGASGSIEQRKLNADDRFNRLGAQITRFDARLETREAALRSQFELLQAISTQAQSQQNSLSSLFYY